MIKHSEVLKECHKIYNKKSTSYNGATAAKVIREYFDVVGKTILSGQEFKFGYNKGSICIIKRKAKKTDKITNCSPRIGFDYDIVMTSEYLNRYDYEFKPAPKLRNLLFKFIRKGREYIYHGN